MRKFIAILAVISLGLLLASCTAKKYSLAMITDVGKIDDRSFNQGTWEGVQKYANDHNISAKYYQPTAGTTQAYIAAIDLAVKGGAKVVVTPGYLFESAIYTCQDKYPNVTFILIDGQPHSEDYSTYKTGTNVYSILFKEQEPGFLAGYAAVKAGFTQLGFMGGMAVPAVIRYGYGFVQGAEYAATEMNLADNSITVNYSYLGGFTADPSYQTKALGWYTAGTQVIFAAAGGAGSSVMSAAEAQTNKYVIGVDVDQSNLSPTVITSAMKNLASAVEQCLGAYYTNDNSFFKTGQSTIMDSTNAGVGLPTDFSKFPADHPFTLDEYNTIFNELKNNTNNIRTDIIADVDSTGKSITLDQLQADLHKVVINNVDAQQ